MLNKLADSDIMVADMLFATLDPTTRRIELPDGQPMLLTDTVGFVRNLPHRLVESFKSTLEESLLADFLIHVLDANEPQAETFFETTLGVLEELGAGEKPMLTVLNKIDRVEDPATLAALRERHPESLEVSALTGAGLEALIQRFTQILADRVRRLRYRIPQSRGELLAQIHAEAKVISTEYEGNDVVVEALLGGALEGKLGGFLDEDGEEEE